MRRILIYIGPWSQEEDTKLADAIAKHGLGKWSAIAHDLYPRTDNQVNTHNIDILS